MAAEASKLRWLLPLLYCLCLCLATAAETEEGAEQPPKKKSKFLASMPMFVKFSLFWWCVFVMLVMLGFIADRLAWRFYGPKRLYWNIERTFSGVPGLEACWVQFADPSRWSEEHPVAASADVSMVKGPATVEVAAGDEQPTTVLGFDVSPNPGDATEAESQSKDRFEKVPMGPLQEGLGLRLWHKKGRGPLEGKLYCTRICTELNTPADGPWRMTMKTVEVGPAHMCIPGSEVIEVELATTSKAGDVHCMMQGCGDVGSRFFAWWKGIARQMHEGGEAMLDGVVEESRRS